MPTEGPAHAPVRTARRRRDQTDGVWDAGQWPQRDRLIADRNQLDVPGIKVPCRVVRAELRMLSSWLHGKPKDLIVPHGRA